MNWFFWQDPNTRLYRAGCGHKARATDCIISVKTKAIKGCSLAPIPRKNLFGAQIPFCHRCMGKMTTFCGRGDCKSEIFPYDAAFKFFGDIPKELLIDQNQDSCVICELCLEKISGQIPEFAKFITRGVWLPQNIFQVDIEQIS
jgi:hypothetical protein